VFSVINVLFGIPLDLGFAAANSYRNAQLRSSTKPVMGKLFKEGAKGKGKKTLGGPI